METLKQDTTKAPAARGPAAVKAVPKDEAPAPHASPWLVIGLMITSAACVIMAVLTVLPRLRPSEPVKLMDAAVSAWDSGTPADFSAAYSKNAVVVHSDGTKVAGLGAIVADAKSLGQDFSIVRTGDVSVTPSGLFATSTYRFAGAGRGAGVLVLEFAGGKVVKQWEYALP
jgi:hypothetical protein